MCVCLCLCVCMYVCVYNKPSLKSAYWSIKFSANLVWKQTKRSEVFSLYFFSLFLYVFFRLSALLHTGRFNQQSSSKNVSAAFFLITYNTLSSFVFFFLSPFFHSFSKLFSFCAFLSCLLLSLSFPILNGFKFLILFPSCLFSIFLSWRLLIQFLWLKYTILKF